MKIAVVGTGYVGLVSGACFSDMGNDVWCVDTDAEKVAMLQNGGIPIYEPGLEEIIKSNCGNGSLKFTTDIAEALRVAQICFIAVGTPMGEDGSADLQYVQAVAHSIGKNMVRHMYVMDKSTVPVGTAQKVRSAIQEELDLRGSNLTFDVVSNPEFLKEGTAVHDCLQPDRIVIGVESAQADKVMRELYAPYIKSPESLIMMDIASAEMTKYTANSMLATKISFMNEIANICELVGADVNKVRLGIGSDSRIGYQFINPGCGYGGSCFPKDVQALIRTSSQNGYTPRILQAVEDVNTEQKTVLPRRICAKYGSDLSGMTFAIWGLAFKPDTDDMRSASSIVIINELTRCGAKVHAFDPKAEREARTCYLKGNQNVEYFDGKYDCLKGCNALILVTEWKEFRSPDFDRIKENLTDPVIFDGRNQYDGQVMRTLGIEYHQIGVGDKFIDQWQG